MAAKKKQKGTGFITDMDCYLFGKGTHYEIYEKLGAHPRTLAGKKGCISPSGHPTPQQ